MLESGHQGPRLYGISMKHITIAAILLAAIIVPPVVSTTATGQIASDLDNPKITFEYGRPDNSFFRSIYLRMTQRKVLEQLKQFLAPLQLPAELGRPLLLRTKECKRSEPAGELNAWYSPGEVAMARARAIRRSAFLSAGWR